MKKLLYFIPFFGFSALSAFSQKSIYSNFYDNPIVIDSSSTIVIPTRYTSDFLSTNKLASWGDYYANLIFYDFNNDTYKKLFDKDTYIVGFNNRYSYRYDNNQKKMTSNWMFYRVKHVDHNKSGRIDSHDPTLLYVSDLHGNNLKALTTENENVVAIDLFEKQNFALLKIQLDQDNDGDFETEDKSFYYIKLDLTTLAFGKKIELK